MPEIAYGKCKNCLYQFDLSNLTEYECRRYPPVKKGTSGFLFPTFQQDHADIIGCGEFVESDD